MPDIGFSGGINQAGDFSIQDVECSDGQNFKLDQNTLELRRREPQDEVDDASAEVTAIMQLIKRDDTQTQLVVAGTTVYSWDFNTLTSKGTITADSRLREAYWSLDDILVVTDLDMNNVVKTWNGTTWANLTHGIGGVTNLKAKYAVEHAHRMWLFNIDTDATALPHVCIASEFEDVNTFDSTNQSNGQDQTFSFPSPEDAFFMTTPNLRPINGVVKFFDTLIVSTVGGALFRLEGFDNSDFRWTTFYPRSAALGDEAIQTIGNDVIFMKAGGAIDLLSSTEQFGDVAVDDLSRFILDEVSGLSDAQIVYDQVNQQVLFFVSNKVLVLDKSRIRSGVSPWTKYTTAMSNSFNTKAAKFLRLADKTYKVYWGDSDGKIYDFRGTVGNQDGGSDDIVVNRTLKRIPREALINGKAHGSVEYMRVAETALDLAFNWHGKTKGVTRSSVKLKGPIVTGDPLVWGGTFYFGGDYYWNSGVIDTTPISYKPIAPAGQGDGVTIELTSTGADDLRVHRLSI